MGTEVIVNKKWSLTARQWLLGLLQTVLPPVLLKVAAIASEGSLSFSLTELVAIAIASGAPYIIRKLNENNVVTVQKGGDDDDKSGPHPPGSPIHS